MKKDFPEYMPPFLQDFHDGKDTVKAFYTFLEMMDNKQRIDNDHQIDRPAMCTWVDFHCLLLSFLDFMNQLGYRMYQTRGLKERPDTFQLIREFKELPDIWYSLINPDAQLVFRADYCVEHMDKWGDGWKRIMPTSAVMRYESIKNSDKK